MFRQRIAQAAGTDPARASPCTRCTSTTRRAATSPSKRCSINTGCTAPVSTCRSRRDVVERTAAAVQSAIADAQVATHLGLGAGEVEKVASNRRILGPDGKVQHVRWTATKDPLVRDFPAGTIDPQLKLISFWNGDKPIAAVTFYATHPQSYYRTGLANPDFPGLARNARREGHRRAARAF